MLDEQNNVKQMYARIDFDHTQKVSLIGIPTAGVFEESSYEYSHSEYKEDVSWWDTVYYRTDRTLEYVEVFYTPVPGTQENKLFFPPRL